MNEPENTTEIAQGYCQEKYGRRLTDGEIQELRKQYVSGLPITGLIDRIVQPRIVQS